MSSTLPLRVGPLLAEIAARKGYVWFRGRRDLNVWVIRAPERNTNLYDDVMVVVWMDDDGEHVEAWPCTADPGRAALLEPRHPAGCARLLEGQHRRSHKLGLHKGRPALRQVRPIPYRRDASRTGAHRDVGPVHIDVIGANVHDAAGERDGLVDRQSEACIVHRYTAHTLRLVELVKMQRDAGLGDEVTITIVDAGQTPAALAVLHLVLPEGA